MADQDDKLAKSESGKVERMESGLPEKRVGASIRRPSPVLKLLFPFLRRQELKDIKAEKELLDADTERLESHEKHYRAQVRTEPEAQQKIAESVRLDIDLELASKQRDLEEIGSAKRPDPTEKRHRESMEEWAQRTVDQAVEKGAIHHRVKARGIKKIEDDLTALGLPRDSDEWEEEFEHRLSVLESAISRLEFEE